LNFTPTPVPRQKIFYGYLPVTLCVYSVPGGRGNTVVPVSLIWSPLPLAIEDHLFSQLPFLLFSDPEVLWQFQNPTCHKPWPVLVFFSQLRFFWSSPFQLTIPDSVGETVKPGFGTGLLGSFPSTISLPPSRLPLSHTFLFQESRLSAGFPVPPFVRAESSVGPPSVWMFFPRSLACLGKTIFLPYFAASAFQLLSDPRGLPLVDARRKFRPSSMSQTARSPVGVL